MPHKKIDRSHMTNISIPKETRDAFNTLRDELSEKFGFSPTQAQTFNYLIKFYREHRHD